VKNNNFKLAFKLAYSELRHGYKHFRSFIACLLLGVTVMAIVNTLGSVVENSLNNEAQSLLGGDLEVRIRGLAANEEQLKYLEQFGEVSNVVTLRSMLNANDQNLLVEIKAIDQKYPLLGDLEFNQKVSKDQAFENNGVAVDQILLSQMGLNLGDKIQLGQANYEIRATIKNEPDRVVQLFSFGPRVMMNQQSLQNSGLVNTFSLIEHRYRIDVPDNIIADEKYEDQIEDQLEAKFPDISWRVRSGNDGNRGVQRFLDQLLSFLNLSALSTFLIAGIGIASSVRSYMEKKSKTIAILKIQGGSKDLIFKSYAILIAMIALLTGLVGIAISSVVTISLLPLFSGILPSLEGQTGFNINSSLLALWYGFLISYIFSLPALYSALKVKPSLLFRSKISRLGFSADGSAIFIIIILTILLLITLLFNAGDIKFIATSLLVILLAFFIFAYCSVLLRKATDRIKSDKIWLKLALGNMNRPGSTTSTVIFAIGISLTVLITLTLTEANLQERISKTVNEKAPSLFMIDIQPDQKQGLKSLLAKYADERNIMMSPMVRGRIVKIDGGEVIESEIGEEIDWVVRGDRGISYTSKEPKNANIVAGKWWPEDYQGKALMSVDDRFLSGMNLEIGDTITVNILGNDITAEIANARKIDYTTFQINFAMMLSPGVIDDYPHSTIATVFLNDPNGSDEADLVRQIAQQYPGVTIIRTKEVVTIVKDILNKIGLALNITVIVSLIAGILVLSTALTATMEQRMYDTAMLKVLGAGKSTILKTYLSEWIILAFITSALASVIGVFGAYLINDHFRGREFYLMSEIIISVIFSCVAIINIIGFVGNRKIFNLRPSKLLRNE
jgi:putative ABC transport system permease protein